MHACTILIFVSTYSSIAINVTYTVNYHEKGCVAENFARIPSINVSIPCGGTALQVMKSAVDYQNSTIGQMYRFSATFNGNTQGYTIDAINNVPTIFCESLATCKWRFLIQTPDRYILVPSIGVSNYTFTNGSYSMIMQYSTQDAIAGFNTTNTSSTPGTCSGTPGSIAAAASVYNIIIAAVILVGISSLTSV